MGYKAGVLVVDQMGRAYIRMGLDVVKCKSTEFEIHNERGRHWL